MCWGQIDLIMTNVIHCAFIDIFILRPIDSVHAIWINLGCDWDELIGFPSDSLLWFEDSDDDVMTLKSFLHHWPIVSALQRCHNERNGVSNHLPHDCLLNRLIRLDQRKHQSSTSQAFVRGIPRCPVNSPHKGPVTRKMFHSMTSPWDGELR